MGILEGGFCELEKAIRVQMQSIKQAKIKLGQSLYSKQATSIMRSL
jgi:hypothetical protein